MGNSYFQFKQFKVEQDNCAMKVSTDACIHGAWTPIADNIKRILDIGAGTGLLSLMLAQRVAHDVIIDAVELDEIAAAQAKENFEASPWADRLKVVNADINNYQPSQLYDVVICNPPFFQNSLLGPDEKRNAARHTHTLSYESLLAALLRVMNPEGYASILLPAEEYKVWKQLLISRGWYVWQELHVQPNEKKQANRVISICSQLEKPLVQEPLVIYNADRTYTSVFKELMADYYLAL